MTARSGNLFRVTLESPVELRGFSGAPFVDVEGRLVGVMSGVLTAWRVGDRYYESGGEDASLLLRTSTKPAP